jgi:hypothetical protein
MTIAKVTEKHHSRRMTAQELDTTTGWGKGVRDSTFITPSILRVVWSSFVLHDFFMK